MVEKRSVKNLSLKTGLQIINFNGADEQPEVSMEGNYLDLGVLSVALMADGLMKHVHNSRLHCKCPSYFALVHREYATAIHLFGVHHVTVKNILYSIIIFSVYETCLH
jgi:hypothetical protein